MAKTIHTIHGTKREEILMEKRCLYVAENIKKIMYIGFGFKEACKIFDIAEKSYTHASELVFVEEIYEIGNGRTKSIDCYNHYVKWAVIHEIQPMTHTKFGLILNNFVTKERLTDGVHYNLTIKEF